MKTPSYKIGTYDNEFKLRQAVEEWSAKGYRIEHLNTSLAVSSGYGTPKEYITYTLAMVRWPDYVAELCGEKDPLGDKTCTFLMGHGGNHDSAEKVRGWR